MTEARQVFEAMMRGNGHNDLTRIGDKYNVPSLQTRWRYFLLGWEMSAAMCGSPPASNMLALPVRGDVS